MILRTLLFALCSALLIACEGTVVRKSPDGVITVADGSAASKSAYQETIIDIPGFGTVTKKVWAKDQTDVPKKWMFWKGVPGVMDAAGGLTKDVANGVGTVIK